MKHNGRMTRINEEIKREISYIIRDEIKDPRVPSILSVVKVETTPDLKYCTIYVSVLGSDEEQKEALEGLKSAVGYIRKELAKRLNLRNTPQLKMVLDDSIEYSVKMSKLLDKIHKHEGESQEE